MRDIIRYGFTSLFTVGIFIFNISCNNNDNNKADSKWVNNKTGPRQVKKPASTYPDTLAISKSAAVFYHTDSLQLEKIKVLTDSMIFDGMMHEFFYQMRNARMVIKRTWPGLTIIEAKNCKVILFIKEDNTREFIDLDTKKDPYGLFIFNGKKSPLLVDMTNIETEISFYLKE